MKGKSLINQIEAQKKWEEMFDNKYDLPATYADFVALIRDESVPDDAYTDLTFLREVTEVVRKNEIDTLIREPAELIALDMYEAIIDRIIEVSGETYGQAD